MSDIQTRMRSANPVPDARAEFGQEDLDALLILTRARSGDMDMKEDVTRAAPSTTPRRGWLIGVAAFAAILVIVGVAVVLTAFSTDDVPPATTPPTTQAPAPTTTEAVVTTTQPVVTTTEAASSTTVPALDAEAIAFIELLVGDINAGAHEQAGARIEQVPQINRNGYVPGVEEDDWTSFFQRMYEYWTVVDSRLSIGECRTSETSGITRCALTRESNEVFPTASEELVVLVRLDSGQLAYYEQGPEVLSQYWQDFLAFDEWLYETTIDEDAAVFGAWFGFASPAERAIVEQEYGSIWAEAGRPRIGG